jgi:hypothetical protein
MHSLHIRSTEGADRLWLRAVSRLERGDAHVADQRPLTMSFLAIVVGSHLTNDPLVRYQEVLDVTLRYLFRPAWRAIIRFNHAGLRPSEGLRRPDSRIVTIRRLAH